MILLGGSLRWCQLVEVAEEVIRALARGRPRAVIQLDDLKARTKPYECLTGGRYHLPHAGVHGALLPQVPAFNAPAAPGASWAARALGVRAAPISNPRPFTRQDLDYLLRQAYVGNRPEEESPS
jgi:hypothetical protein